ARVVHAGTAGGGRGRFEVAGELGDLLLEHLQGTECLHVEHRHEASVIVPTARLDAEAKTGEQSAQYFHHGREAAALVSLAAAQREQRAALAQSRAIGALL